MELEQLSLAKSAEESLLVLAQIKQPDCALLSWMCRPSMVILCGMWHS